MYGVEYSVEGGDRSRWVKSNQRFETRKEANAYLGHLLQGLDAGGHVSAEARVFKFDD